MAKMVDRGSFIWFLMSATQIWISFVILEEATAAVETLFGAGAAACFVLGLFVFKREQMNKEVHADMQKKQGTSFWLIIGLWLAVMTTSSFIF
ncbi:MAG TPA: hypothetical protein EYO09_02335 [Candidatus Poseidoniales archaeon]|nr:hypothetical protein [Candidatus Poseidoniales archaeon]